MMTSPWFAAPWLRLTEDFGQASQAATPAAVVNSSMVPILRAIWASFAISRTPPARQTSRGQPVARHLMRLGPDRLGQSRRPGGSSRAKARPSQLIAPGRRYAPPDRLPRARPLGCLAPASRRQAVPAGCCAEPASAPVALAARAGRPGCAGKGGGVPCLDDRNRGRLRDNAEPAFSGSQPTTPGVARSIRLAALCLPAEADSLTRAIHQERDHADLGRKFRSIAAGSIVIERRATDSKWITERIMLAID